MSFQPEVVRVPDNAKRNWIVALLVGVLLLSAACATAPPASKAELPVLIDPRLGYEGVSSEPVERKFVAAWQKLSGGQLDAADKAFASLSTRYPQYSPSTLARAVVALGRNDLDLAERYVEKVADPNSSYFAAEAYRGEIALARGLTEDAWRSYERITRLRGVPVIVSTRAEFVSDAWFEELVARADATESDRERIDFLEEAIRLRPRADATRIALAKRLIEVEQWERARAEVEVLLDRGLVDDSDVQAIVADLEAAEGRFEDAIVRLERLAQRSPGRGHEERLAEVKLDYMRANLPPRYHRAVASSQITRTDLAVLAYWHVSAVRFTRVSEPPIAVDIAGAPGRDEIVKALGLGILSVDPATRAVGPDVPVSARAFVNATVRLMRLGATPECASELSGVAALSACGIDLSRFLEDPAGAVRGQDAVNVFDGIDDLLDSAE